MLAAPSVSPSVNLGEINVTTLNYNTSVKETANVAQNQWQEERENYQVRCH